MATYRQIHVRIWQDKKVEELSPQGKLLFIYSWSNTHRNEVCLYELTKRKIANETGIDMSNVDEVLAEVEAANLIRYDHENDYIWAKNAINFQSINSNNMTAILRDLSECKSPLAAECANYHREALESHVDRWGMPWEWDEHGIPMACSWDGGKGKGKGKGNKDKDTTTEAAAENEIDKIPYKTIIGDYNETCVSLARAVTVTENRKKAIGARWKNIKSLEEFHQYFVRVEKSDFLRGKNDRQWKADFDWLMNEQNMAKVLEGKYDNRASPTDYAPSTPPGFKVI